jgi:hypothetical protein
MDVRIVNSSILHLAVESLETFWLQETKFSTLSSEYRKMKQSTSNARIYKQLCLRSKGTNVCYISALAQSCTLEVLSLYIWSVAVRSSYSS